MNGKAILWWTFFCLEVWWLESNHGGYISHGHHDNDHAQNIQCDKNNKQNIYKWQHLIIIIFFVKYLAKVSLKFICFLVFSSYLFIFILLIAFSFFFLFSTFNRTLLTANTVFNSESAELKMFHILNFQLF